MEFISKNQRFILKNTTEDLAEKLAHIQQACFPTLAKDELITSDHYQTHVRTFPEGQHVVLLPDGTPVASSTDMRTDFDFDHPEHRYMEITGNNWLTTHNPKGQWLYGVDIGVHPNYRGYGLSRALYEARRALVKRLGLKGHLAGGMIKGFGKYKDQMDAKTYIDQVVSGKIIDPVLTVQLKQGFSVGGIIKNYLDDPSCDNTAALIVWRNPESPP